MIQARKFKAIIVLRRLLKELVESCLHDEDISLGDIVDEIGDLEIAIEEESEAEFVEIIRKEVHDQKTTSFWTQHFPEVCVARLRMH